MHNQQQQLQQEQNVMPLQKPPKWLKKPVGANFGVSFTFSKFYDRYTDNRFHLQRRSKMSNVHTLKYQKRGEQYKRETFVTLLLSEKY